MGTIPTIPVPAPTPEKTEIEVKLGDGSVVKGANLEEAFKNLSEMKVNASTAAKDKADLYESEKRERERLQREFEQLQEKFNELQSAPPPKPATPPQTDGKNFSKDTYFQLLGEDPMKAQDYLDAYRFGLEAPEQVRDTFNGMRQGLERVSQQVDNFTQQNVTSAFLAQHPEYPQGDMAAAKALTGRVSELTKQGFPYSSQTVEFAYYQLVNSDEIKPLDLSETPVPGATTTTTPAPTETPNPSLSGATVVSEEAQKAETMSDGDLLKLLQSKGMFR